MKFIFNLMICYLVILGALSAKHTPHNFQKQIGDYGQFVLLGVGMYATYYYEDPQGLEQYALSTLTSLAAMKSLKYLVNRERPDGSNHSFPSGHTSFSFSSASFLQRRYNAYWGVPAYLLASYVGYTRVIAERHYITDVLAGAALSIAINAVFVDKKMEFNLANTTYNINVYPMMFANNHIGVGLSLYYK